MIFPKKNILEIDYKDSSPYKLSEEQLAAVKEGQEQIKAGKFLTGKQANKEIDEWLRK